MAKKPSLVELAKQIKPNRGGQKDWREGLTPQGLKDYEEFLHWMRTAPEGERITNVQAIAEIKKYFGRNISQHTFHKHLNGQ
jgi:hypothetical protein